MISRAVPLSCKIYTPLDLASAIVQALGDAPTARWLEPSVGRGAFVAALAKHGVGRARLRAVDIDRSRQPLDASASTLRGRDFLAWARRTNERFDRIIGNPPFVALEALTPFLRRSACRAPVPSFASITPGSNYWHAFLCASLALLKPRGHLGFVLPAAWEYADYAHEIRSGIQKHFELVEVHRCLQPLFDSVQDGAVVLIVRGYRNGPGKLMREEHVTTTELIRAVKRHPLPTRRRFHRHIPTTAPAIAHHGTVHLRELMRISIGAVTGDADYFLLSEQRRKELGLPSSCLRPALTKARHLVAGVVNRSVWRTLLDRGERVWLFRPSDRHLALRSVRRYLRLSQRNGGCDRSAFKVRTRSPWHRVALPTSFHGFLSGMSTIGPWVCLNQMKSLVATNTLYVVTFESELTLQERFALAVTLQTSTVAARIRERGRVYAQGLLKFEPSDLLDVSVRMPQRVAGARDVYLRIARLLASRNVDAARKQADCWYSQAMLTCSPNNRAFGRSVYFRRT